MQSDAFKAGSSCAGSYNAPGDDMPQFGIR